MHTVGEVRSSDVAVVIAAHQAERTIAAALRSVLAQTRAVREIVVVDDGSTDDTSAAAAAVDGAVTVHRLARNVGVAAALNEGIAATTAGTVMFLDADDLWAPHKVDVQVAALAGDPTVDAVFAHSAQFVDTTGEMSVAAATAAAGPPMVGVHKSTLAIRRAALERVGAFDPAFHRADLIEWLARSQASGLRTGVVAEVVHLRRLHDLNMGRHHRDEQREQYAAVMRTISRRRRDVAPERRA